MRRITAGQGRLQDLDDLLAIAAGMEGKTICVFADAAAWPIQSYIAKFRDEFEAYIRSGRNSPPYENAERMEAAPCPG
jgi:NADH-quinone oxidoreductase subunit F